MFLSSGIIDSQDGFQYVEVARNIYYNGEPTGPLYKYDTRENIFMAVHEGKDGKSYSNVGLGFSLAMVPAVALTDLIYKIYGVSPPVNFPLENDWLILLTTSFTNSFFGALLGITLFLFLFELGLTKKQGLLVSMIGMFTTNLLVYTKYAFAHMMFVSCLFLAFYLVRRHFQTGRFIFLITSGISYGLMVISYNQTFVLTIPPLLIYFVLLSKPKLKFLLGRQVFSYLKKILIKLLVFSFAVLIFFLLYIWYEDLRSGATQNLSSPVVLAKRGLNPLKNLPVGVFIEGVFGQLLSPGRSFFLYSPIILLILIFWHKLKEVSLKVKKTILPELVVFLIFFFIYILFFASQYSAGSGEQGIAGLWHGESSWGPRYLLPLIPFGLLIVGYIYIRLSKWQKLFVALPLLFIGLYVQLLGSIMPYQIKYHDLQDKFFVNSTEYTNFTYSNLIPRFSPVFMMSKKLFKLATLVPATLVHGEYNIKFYDGIDFPFPVGNERWRVIDSKGFISFDNSERSPVKKISFDLINHPIEEASYSATVRASINNILLKEETFLPQERKTLNLEASQSILKENDNQLILDVQFKSLKEDIVLKQTEEYRDNPEDYADKTVQPKKTISQILSIISLSVNEVVVNKESLDFPYVSSLGPVMSGKEYKNYGKLNRDPWKSWEIHTQIYERVPDFWWFKLLYYWDVPKTPILLLFVTLLSIIIFSSFNLIRLIGRK